jgi:transcriptional regulator with XRE-family HTH domain
MTGKELRERREALKTTQGELGDVAGVAQSNIAAMESGKRPIGKKMAKRMEAALRTRKEEIDQFNAWLNKRDEGWMDSPELVELRRQHGMK